MTRIATRRTAAKLIAASDDEGKKSLLNSALALAKNHGLADTPASTALRG